MTTRQTPRSDTPSGKTAKSPERITLPAGDVGVTLRVSDEALKKLDRIREEALKAAQEYQKFFWC